MSICKKQEPEMFEVNGKNMRCHHCNGESFFKREVMPNTRLLTFMNLDALNRTANCLIYADCGFIHWFAEKE